MNQPLPTARVEAPPARSLAWILPVITLIAVALLGYEAWRSPGIDVRVRVAQGHGLSPGAALRFRGVEVGRVAAIELSRDLSSVELRVRVDGEAAGLAREGARFWVERARIAPGSVSGLETLFAGPHLVVEPGAAGARAQRQFQGLAAAPLDDAGGAGLEIVVEAPRRGGVAAGAPVSYRQLPVGRVLSVGLSSDAGAVELRLWIEREYAALVRARTRFWEASGLDLRAGLLDGFSLSMDSLESLLSGGIAFASPPDGGAPARTGQRFALAGELDPKWLEWRPQVAVGKGELLPGGAPARPMRASLSFESGRLWTSTRTRSGWVLPMDGVLVGPADLLLAPTNARALGGTLEFEGRATPVRRAETDGELEGLALLEADDLPASGWPRERRRALEAPEDVLLWADPAAEPLAVAASRWRAETGADGAVAHWTADDGLGLDPAEWHGALVLSRADGALLGLVRAESKNFDVWPLPKGSPEPR